MFSNFQNLRLVVNKSLPQHKDASAGYITERGVLSNTRISV